MVERGFENDNAGSLSQHTAMMMLQSEFQQLLRGQRTDANGPDVGIAQPGALDRGQSDSRLQAPHSRGGNVPIDGDNSLPITFKNIYPSESSFAEAPGDRTRGGAVKIEEFPAAAKRVIGKIDTNHDGHLTKAELATAMQNHSLAGRDAQVVAALYRNFDHLQNLSHHKALLEMPNITAGDLEALKQLPPAKYEAAAQAIAVQDWSHERLPKFDADHKGFLSKADVEHALHNLSVGADDKKMLQFIQDHYDRIEHSEKGHHSGITTARLDEYVKSKLLCDDQTEMIRRIMRTCDRVNNVAADHPLKLFADEKHPLESIRPDAIRQGTIGDCYFESVVAGMANTQSGKEQLFKMMHDNGDGTVTVKFPGAPKEPIRVKIPTQAEVGLYNGSGPKGEIWGSVLEKAAGEYATKHPKEFAQLFDYMPQEGVSRGGQERWTIKLLTNHGADEFLLHANNPIERHDVQPEHEVANALQWALKTQPPKVIVASTEGDKTSEVTADGFPRNHSYTIVGFAPGGPGGGRVTIRNPWADPSQTTDGLVSITLDKFVKNFQYMTFEMP